MFALLCNIQFQVQLSPVWIGTLFPPPHCSFCSLLNHSQFSPAHGLQLQAVEVVQSPSHPASEHVHPAANDSSGMRGPRAGSVALRLGPVPAAASPGAAVPHQLTVPAAVLARLRRHAQTRVVRGVIWPRTEATEHVKPARHTAAGGGGLGRREYISVNKWDVPVDILMSPASRQPGIGSIDSWVRLQAAMHKTQLEYLTGGFDPSQKRPEDRH